MKVTAVRFLSISMVTALMLGSCPLPYDYSGKGAGGNQSPDPSTPRMTSAVTVSCTEQGGGTTAVGNDGIFFSEKTTTVTLTTATDNSVIYYTDDKTVITNVSLAKRINGSSGDLTITRTTSVQSVDIHAMAVGPNMLPSPSIHFTVVVSPYPVLRIACNKTSVSDTGCAGSICTR